MHQPDTKRRPSVFYGYEVFPFRRPPEMDRASDHHKVLIVGAGPVALTTALLLAKSHQPFVDNGLSWDSGRSFYRGQEVFHMRLPHDDDDRFMPVLPLLESARCEPRVVTQMKEDPAPQLPIDQQTGGATARHRTPLVIAFPREVGGVRTVDLGEATIDASDDRD